MGLRVKNGTFCLHILLDSSGQKSDYKVNQSLGTSHTMLPSLVKTKLKPAGWKLALKPTKRSALRNFGCIFCFLIQNKIAGDRSCSEWKDFSFKQSGVFLWLDDQCDPNGALWLPQRHQISSWWAEVQHHSPEPSSERVRPPGRHSLLIFKLDEPDVILTIHYSIKPWESRLSHVCCFWKGKNIFHFPHLWVSPSRCAPVPLFPSIAGFTV